MKLYLIPFLDLKTKIFMFALFLQKKRRRRRKNNKSISKSESNSRKKWRISREKIREQNLLLKKLGK